MTLQEWSKKNQNIWEKPFTDLSVNERKNLIRLLIKNKQTDFPIIEGTVSEMVRLIQIEDAAHNGRINFALGENTLFYAKFAYLFGFLLGRKIMMNKAKKIINELK